MIYFQDEQRATVWKVEDKGNYSEVQFSTSRKDKNNEGEWLNSGWSFVRFVGEAHKKAAKLERGARILLKGAGMTKESYIDKNGDKQYPKSPQIVVFNFSVSTGAGKPKDSEESHEDADTVSYDDELPF